MICIFCMFFVVFVNVLFIFCMMLYYKLIETFFVMKVKITMIPKTEDSIVEFDGKIIGDILKSLKLDREVYVFKKNGKVVTESEPLSFGDHIEVIKVVSGG